MDMRCRFIHVQYCRNDIFGSESFSQPCKVIGTPRFQASLLNDTQHILLCAGQHDTNYPHLIRPDFTGQSGMFEPMVDCFRSVGDALRKFDKFFIQVGQFRHGIGRHFGACDMSGHRYFVVRRLIQMQYDVSHDSVIILRLMISVVGFSTAVRAVGGRNGRKGFPKGRPLAYWGFFSVGGPMRRKKP